MRRKWEKGDFVYFPSRNFLLELSALRGSKKPPKKPHGVRAWTSEPEASAPGVARESNHGKDGKHRKEEAAWVVFTCSCCRRDMSMPPRPIAAIPGRAACLNDK
jgi:hypothetical protein